MKRNQKGQFIKGHKVPEEWRKKSRQKNKGRKNPHSKKWSERISKAKKGYKVAKLTKEKISKSLKEYCKLHPEMKEWLRNWNKIHSPWNKGIPQSQKTKEKLSKTMTGRYLGSKHWNWQGGITPLTFQIRNHPKYLKWRSSIFEKDNYTCVKCGKRGGCLEADHYPKGFAEIFHEYKIKSLEEALACKEFWNINSGRALHKKCHRPWAK